MALREVSDESGVSWTIYDVQPSLGRRGVPQVQTDFVGGWLCFQCSEEKRRLPGIPRGWEQLDDLALIALLSSAKPASAVPRFGRS